VWDSLHRFGGPLTVEVLPPINPLDGMSLTISDPWIDDMDICSSSLREVVQMFVLDSIDNLTDEEILLMPAWEAINEPKMASKVRQLAKACPTLKDFEWYMDWRDVADSGPVWNWKIHRDQTPERNLRMSSGHLFWKGCPRGDPPPLLTLVGTELEHRRGMHVWPNSYTT
jgi:hypothetical protein